MKHLIATAAALLALAISANASENRRIKLRALCFQHVNEIKKVHVLSPAGGAAEVELFSSSISDEVEATAAGGVLSFGLPGEKEGTFRTIATARALAGPRQLAVFIPGEPGREKDAPYRCFMLDDSLANFPMGSTMAVNLSPVAFRFNIGEHDKAVQPGKIETIPMARKTNDRGQVSVIISIADAEAEGGWRAVNQTRWFTGTDKRDLAIGYIHPQTAQPTVKCYEDTQPGG